MKITLEMDNLQALVTETLDNNLTNIVTKEVDTLITNSVQESRTVIQEIVNERIKNYLDDYLKTATISIGGGWKKEPKTYTVEEYIKKEISEIMDSGKFLAKKSNGYSDTTYYKTFDEYVKETFNVNATVQKSLNDFMTGVRKDVDKNVSEMFNQTTRAALSESIINLLMRNDTFLNMQDSIKRISSRD